MPIAWALPFFISDQSAVDRKPEHSQRVSPLTMHRTARALSAFLLCLLSTACGRDAGSAALGDGSVWVVESPTTKVYLCGTIHLLRSRDYPLPEAYNMAYADSQRLVFELPPGSAEDAGLAQKMRNSGSYPQGTSLRDKLSPQCWKSLNEWCQKRGQNALNFNSYRPWFVALNVTAAEYTAVGAEADRGVDSFFEDKAKRDGKPGEGLETVDFQISLFANLKEDAQQELLEQTLEEVKHVPEEYEKMITAWRNGDANTLHQMLFEEAKEHPELLDLFLVKRNRSWIAPLEAFLRGKEHIMVLVGTGHLGGETGVMEMLRAKGYTVRKVQPIAKSKP